jgi:hypothetical protein
MKKESMKKQNFLKLTKLIIMEKHGAVSAMIGEN